jgi:hypothetical protein
MAAAAVIASALNAEAIDYVTNAPDYATFENVAKAGGFYQYPGPGPRGTTTAGMIKTTGTLAGGGSWFFNYVGIVYEPTGNTVLGTFGPVPEMSALSGVWARLRFNGFPTENLNALISTARSLGADVYSLEPIGPNNSLVWTKDGVTVAPDYVATIGLIQ